MPSAANLKETHAAAAWAMMLTVMIVTPTAQAYFVASSSYSTHSPSLLGKARLSLRGNSFNALYLRGGDGEGDQKQEIGNMAPVESENATTNKTCPHGISLSSDERCPNCEVLGGSCAFVLQRLGGKANTTEFANTWTSLFSSLKPMSVESARENVAPAMNATGYFIVEEIEGSEDKMLSFSEKAQRTCPHGISLDSPERCMACEEISFLRRWYCEIIVILPDFFPTSEKIITEAGGSIDTISFADKWNEVIDGSVNQTSSPSEHLYKEFNATGSTDAMTSEAAASKVDSEGFTVAIGPDCLSDTEDPGIKTFTLRPQPEEQQMASDLSQSTRNTRGTGENDHCPSSQYHGSFQVSFCDESGGRMLTWTYQRALIQEAMYAHAEKEREQKQEEIQKQLIEEDLPPIPKAADSV
eukprot:765335-Hanusia_phi.AAC.7